MSPRICKAQFRVTTGLGPWTGWWQVFILILPKLLPIRLPQPTLLTLTSVSPRAPRLVGTCVQCVRIHSGVCLFFACARLVSTSIPSLALEPSRQAVCAKEGRERAVTYVLWKSPEDASGPQTWSYLYCWIWFCFVQIVTVHWFFALEGVIFNFDF